MFNKLVANLPFNPGLINQIGFYSDRLQREKSIRRLSFVFMALAMAVQSLAVISPPEPSLAASGNDIITGGVSSRTAILKAYDNPSSDVKEIFESYNISREDLAALPSTPNSSVRTNDGNNWISTGRNSISTNPKINQTYKNNEVKFQYSGIDTATASDDKYVYQRQLRAWDIRNSYNVYTAFKGKSSKTGQEFWILTSCGNITFKDRWAEPPQPVIAKPIDSKKTTTPRLEIKKSIEKSASTLKPGDSYTYQIEYRNNINRSVARNVVIEDQLDLKNYDVIAPKDLDISATGYLKYPIPVLQYSREFHLLEITVQLKNQLPSPQKICNSARITADGAASVNSNEVCLNIITPCPFDPSIPDTNNPQCSQPKVACELLETAINRTNRTANFKTIASSSNEALITINSYFYSYGDGTQESFPSGAFAHEAQHTYGPGEFEASVTVRYSAPDEYGGRTDLQTRCTHDLKFDEDAPLGEMKTVENITQDLSGNDAINTVVKPGDVLEYKLTTLNSQKYSREEIVVSDYIGDILEYADLNLEHLEASGGRFDKNSKKVIWENLTIPASSKLENTFQVTLMNPIPATNEVALSGTHDCHIANTYGNDIGLDVQCPVVKSIEALPNTGTGSSLIMGFGATSIVGYLFARSRLLAKELEYVKVDFITTGGLK